MKNFDQIIIGAGAAGLFAAAHSKLKTLILEKKSSPGNKLLIAGQGRCNFTHSGKITDFFTHYGENSGFIKHALKKFTNVDLIDFFKSRGLEITEDRNGKLFPQSGNARDILEILLKECKKNGHLIKLNEPVLNLSNHQGIFVVNSKTEQYSCHKLIVTTGGMSYPSTGSSGDGYAFAKIFGHSIVSPKPSLSPVYVKRYIYQDLAGVSLKDCCISLHRNTKKIKSHTGDIGFTHKGLSGPGILDFSRYMLVNDILKINISGISIDEFNRRFLEEVRSNGKSTVQVFLRQFDIPKGLSRFILSEIHLEPSEKIGNITRDQRKNLAEKFCELPFDIERIGGYHIAMATAGGVALDEVNPKTMESKLQKGLFFAGEVLDIDGDTGGYNLQAAFSGGYLAATGSK